MWPVTKDYTQIWSMTDHGIMMVSSTSDGHFCDSNDNEVDWRALNKMY
jgi:hypothetical protein